VIGLFDELVSIEENSASAPSGVITAYRFFQVLRQRKKPDFSTFTDRKSNNKIKIRTNKNNLKVKYGDVPLKGGAGSQASRY
jgi:hypothetical protein